MWCLNLNLIFMESLFISAELMTNSSVQEFNLRHLKYHGVKFILHFFDNFGRTVIFRNVSAF